MHELRDVERQSRLATVQSHTQQRFDRWPKLMLSLSLVFLSAGGWFYWLSDRGVPSLYHAAPNSVVAAIAEQGVRLGVVIGSDDPSASSGPADESAPVDIITAWPKSLGRRPAIYVALESSVNFTDVPYYTSSMEFWSCSPADDATVGGVDCHSGRDGLAVELSSAPDASHGDYPSWMESLVMGHAKWFQLLLDDKDADQWELRNSVTARTGQAVQSLLGATGDEYVGGLQLPTEIPVAVSARGSRATVVPPYAAREGGTEDDFDLCHFVDCISQEDRLNQALDSLNHFDDSPVEAQDPLLARMFDASASRTGFDYLYESVTLGSDWAPIRTSISPVDALTPPAWSIRLNEEYAVRRTFPAALVSSESVAVTERRFGFMAGVFMGIAGGALVAAADAIYRRRDAVRARNTSTPGHAAANPSPMSPAAAADVSNST